MKNLRSFAVDGLWCVHSYYTLCPYAPDGSGRILAAGADLACNLGWVLVLSPDGAVLDRFGGIPVTPSFWHTGFWQSWSPDSRYVYYQAGTLTAPVTIRRELAVGVEVSVNGDLEGCPPSGEPGISCSHGMLYAAGYGDNRWKPEQAPVPFLERERHGISRLHFDPPGETLALTTREILDRHPHRDRLLEAERELKKRLLGPDEGLTLMTYCVRWNPQGSRFLFYFGNHCVVKERGEPKVASVFTADRDLKDIRLAVDFSFDRFGVHWGWQPDGEKLIGYGPHPKTGRLCLVEVRWDGSEYRWLSDHNSGGHPSVSPRDPDLVVTDEGGKDQGSVVFLSRKTGQEVERVRLPKFVGEREARGRNPLRVCHHPVFNPVGDRLLCNSLPDGMGTLIEIAL